VAGNYQYLPESSRPDLPKNSIKMIRVSSVSLINIIRQIHRRRKVWVDLLKSLSIFQSYCVVVVMTMMMMMMRSLFLRGAAITLFWLLAIRPSMALPSGFVDEGFANVNAPTGFSFAPQLSGDGYMMLVCEKGGRVWVLPNPDESDDEIESLDIRDRTCS
jgi:hypothetical protein